MNPNSLRKKINSEEFKININNYKKELIDILNYKSKKFIMIVGPCSIHNYEEYIDYLNKFSEIVRKYESKLFIMIRAYSEKSRSTGHWKGFLNDPNLNNSCDIEKGIELTRKIFYKISEKNIPIATEILCPLTCYYLNDFVTWSAIGARSCEFQINRIVASDFDYPIGFKNDRKGDIKTPIEGIKYSSNKHSFITIDDDGKSIIKKTNGNKNNHIILRGSLDGVNYKKENILETENMLVKHEINTKIIIDCSHDNCLRSQDPINCHKNQEKVVDDVIKQIKEGNKSIGGLMIESNINEGNQKMDNENLKYGVSITDPCINLEDTDRILKKIFDVL